MNKIILVFLGFVGFAQARIGTNVIYGDDDRRELYEATPEQVQWADSTVAFVKASDLVNKGTYSRLTTMEFGPSHSLCTSEKFYSQGSVAQCSAFLVAEDLVATAGHCIAANSDACTKARFIFGFNVKDPSINEWNIPNSEIYSCAKVIFSMAGDKGDFAVVKLDRPVPNHKPVAIRTSGSPQPGDRIIVMGHPAGLPLKVGGGAAIRSVSATLFMSNLDTYGGNSGSAVFNADTGVVEGILVNGETDYVLQNGCYISNRCPDNGCRGEGSTPISMIIPYLKQ